MQTHTPYRLPVILAILVLFIPLVAACGGPTTSPGANTPAGGEPTAATAGEPTAAPAEPTAAPAEPTAAPAEATAAPAEPTPAEGETAGLTLPEVGEALDLGNLSPSVAEPAEPVTIKFASWVGESETMQALAEEFHKLHPNITIDFESVPAEEITDRLLTQVAGGTAPDVAYLDSSVVGTFASRNTLVDLDPYIATSTAVKADDYVPAFRDSATYQGKLYGLPFDGESTGLFYRTDLFEAAGITAPPTNWQEFEEAAKKLTNKDEKRYGFILFAPEAAYYWYPWLWQTGGKLLSEDGKQIQFNNEDGKRAAEYYVRLRDYSPEDFLNSNSYDGRVAFANGTVAMYVAGAWFAGTLRSEFPDIDGKWAAAPLPEDKQCATTVAGDTLVIFANSKNRDAAWKWIEFLSAPQIMALWNIGTPASPGSLLPPRTSLIEDPRAYENNELLRGFADQMKCGVTNAGNNENWGQAEQILNDYLGRAIYGEMDAATAVDQAAQEAQGVLAP